MVAKITAGDVIEKKNVKENLIPAKSVNPRKQNAAATKSIGINNNKNL